MDGGIFHTNRSLLNPKFEGYKLHIIPQEEAVSQFPLTNRPSQVATSGKAPLIFQEVQSRITHNHLVVHSGSNRAVYIDAEYNVIFVELDWKNLNLILKKIYELPTPVQSGAVSNEIHQEYPSAAFFGPDSLLISDGRGTMYVLNLGESIQSEGARLIGKFILPSGESGTLVSPFRIHHVHCPSPSYIIVILSSRHYPELADQPQGKHRTAPQFDVWGVKANLLDAKAFDEPAPLEVLWHRRGEDVPFYTIFDETHRLYLLVGGSEYAKLDIPPLPTYEPTPDEIAPIPRAEGTAYPSAPLKPPPYSWTQSSDSVTIAVPLPSITPKDKIKVLFSLTTLTLHVDMNNEIPQPQGTPVPKYSAKKLWDAISPSSSFWTFDREAERTYGVLSLHLEKANEGTRWPQVFARSEADSAVDENEDVAETLDPSELWNIREALEKYTSALQGEDSSGLGLGKGVPSLAENELDEEVDSSVGRTAFITWIPDPSLQTQPEFLRRREYSTPFQLLSLPIPGQTADMTSLIVKNSIDGTVFTLDQTPLENSKAPTWRHSMTYSALAFVLASKRDTRFTYHIPSGAVMAFESGASNRGGNVYVYYPTDPKAITARQSVLRVDDGRGGALMGVGLFTNNDGRSMIACLTEGDLVLIKGV